MAGKDTPKKYPSGKGNANVGPTVMVGAVVGLSAMNKVEDLRFQITTLSYLLSYLI